MQLPVFVGGHISLLANSVSEMCGDQQAFLRITDPAVPVMDATHPSCS